MSPNGGELMSWSPSVSAALIRVNIYKTMNNLWLVEIYKTENDICKVYVIVGMFVQMEGPMVEMSQCPLPQHSQQYDITS